MEKSFLQTTVDLVKHYAKVTWQRYRKLGIWGKLFIWFLITFYITLGVVLVLKGAVIAQAMYDLAQKLSNMKYGWLIILGFMILVSFPPMTGHTTAMTLCGFAYGMKGFFVGLAGSVLGATAVFVVLRFLFSKRLRKWSATNNKWTALETVVKTKGLPLVILIRLSPMPPWAYANTLFASIHTVALWQFIVATLFLSPKLLLHTFIGSRLAPLSDGEQRQEMDTQTKIINGCLVGGGILLGIAASVIVYRLVQRQLRHLKGVSPSTEGDIIEALEEADEGASLLGNLSSESLLEEGNRQQPPVIRDRDEDD
ncbi:Golgi apparatus membrane protein TVP38 [Thelephora ganbajun]|uniref:Golgi apparatus membrane protein TVP38 n=1 Tax=Thelephora ganbajun TaxID=370292 RepID=A0ACB6ZVI4_THEGA|nr:Golgi apparatus membrane protein TVP38 [Thelephora ganbajun]